MSKIFTLGRTITGKTPSTKVKENWGNDIPFYAPEDIAKGYILDDAIRHVSNQGFNAIKNNTTDGISVLVGCIGSDMGNSAIVERKCAFNQQINAITDFDKDVNPFYVYYYLSTQKDYLRQLAGSTTTPLLPKSDFEQIDIPLPDKYTQDKTVRVLKPIDDKIKNNTAICSDLESMAKLLYDYWFVQFDFPDENGKPYKSSGGKMVWNEELKREIPDGWEVKPLSAVFDITMGSSPSGASLNENGDGIEFYQGSTDFGNIYPTKRVYTTAPVRFSKAQDVLLSVRAPVGTMNIAMNDCCIGRGLAAIHHFSTMFAWNTMLTFSAYFDIFNNNGTTFGALTSDDLKGQLTAVPPENLINKYHGTTIAIEKQIRNLSKENQELASLRDFLLPMLMNGQVTVKKGETQ